MAESRTIYCRCDERAAARAQGVFVYAEQYHSWIFPGDPLRSVKDAWRLSYFGMPNHDGEPMQWTCCPWCGNDLPEGDHVPPYVSEPGEE